MLVPITRSKFEELVPILAMGVQYRYCWGKWSDFLRRMIISIAAVALTYAVLRLLSPDDVEWQAPIPMVIGGLYWWWEPILLASRRNWQFRQFPYSGFWRGEVLDLYVTDNLLRETETVDTALLALMRYSSILNSFALLTFRACCVPHSNRKCCKKGNLVVIEDIETRLNLELGDEMGFNTEISVPLKKAYKGISRGQVVEMLVMSYRPDLSSFAKVSDVYLPDLNLWLSDYPCLRRDAFITTSQRLDEDY